MMTEEAIIELIKWMVMIFFVFIALIVIFGQLGELIYSYREGRLQRFQVAQKKMELEAARLAIDERKAEALERVADALIDVEGRELAAKIEQLGDDAIIDALLEERVEEVHRT